MNINEEDYIEHFGVKGMKWGVRQSKKVTGVSRARGSLIDRNDRMIKIQKDARSGKHYQTSVKLGRKLLGEQKQKENWEKSIKTLSAQNKRLKTGKNLTKGDKADIFFGPTLDTMFLSYRPAGTATTSKARPVRAAKK